MSSIYSVSQINSYIRNMFTQDYMLQSVQVSGEVSNCKYHSSGHIYFTLKDKQSVIACVMFAGSRTGLSFPLKEGMQVVVSGSVDIYERDGRYQLYAKKITQHGIGQLYEKYEALKRELEERGMFSEEYKQPVPMYVHTLGVVTSPTGAAVRDIIQIARRRNPYVQIVLYPAIVQGEAAAPSIINGIRALERMQVDVMIVGRGGGSYEDLWAFNEEAVAQAVFDCAIPVISAVGHETDTTIMDYVADLRAPTPSAAAELAILELSALEEQLSRYRMSLFTRMMGTVQYCRMKIQNQSANLERFSPGSRIRDKRFALMQCEDRLKMYMDRIILKKKQSLAVYIERMRGLSPLDKLNQGFSFVSDSKGNNVHDVRQVKPDDNLVIAVKNGTIDVSVNGTTKRDIMTDAGI